MGFSIDNDEKTLTILDNNLRKKTGNKIHMFGGILMIMVGDLFQIEPTSKTNYINSKTRNGVQ